MIMKDDPIYLIGSPKRIAKQTLKAWHFLLPYNQAL